MEPSIVTPGREENRLRDDLVATVGFGLAPVALVVVAGWDYRLLISVLWFDTALAGVQAIAMILRARKANGGRPPLPVLGAIFFTAHYGFFTFGFGLMAITAYEMLGPNAPPMNPDGSYTMAFDVAGMAADALAKPILLALPLAWRVLRYRRFLARKEAAASSTNGMMGFPYISAMGVWFVGMQILLAAKLEPGAAGVDHTAGVVRLALFRVALDAIETWLRARPTRQPDLMKPLTPPPGVYFDVRTTRFRVGRIWIAASLAIAAAGAMAMAAAPANPLGTFVVLTGLIGAAAYWQVNTARLPLVRALDERTARVAEGVVENFVAAGFGSGRRAAESFSVGGVQFSYRDDVITSGFNRTYRRDGPVRHGLKLRVHYVVVRDANVIARLEVLPAGR